MNNIVEQASLLVKQNNDNDININSQSRMIDLPVEQVFLPVNQNHVIGDSIIKEAQSGMIDLPVGQASVLVSYENTELKEKNIKYKSIKEFQIKRRDLPHWQNPGSVYFLTFRALNIELSNNSKDIIYKSIIFNNNKKYALYSFVIIPDHVHIILQPLESKTNEYFNLSEITHSIKSYSANEINKIEKMKGRQIWQHESFDRIIRNDSELNEKLNYILNNPVKRGLVENGFDYKWFYLDNNEFNNDSINSQSRMNVLPEAQSRMIDPPEAQSRMIELPVEKAFLLIK